MRAHLCGDESRSEKAEGYEDARTDPKTQNASGAIQEVYARLVRSTQGAMSARFAIARDSSVEA